MIINDINDLNIKEEAVIFDCFGTLLRIENKRNPYFKLFKKYGLLNKETLGLIMKEKIFVEDFHTFFNIDLKDIEETKKALKEELDSIVIIPGVLEKLNQFANKKILICSNLSADYADSINVLPIKDKMLSCENKCIKPEVEIYSLCMEKLNLPANKICFVGDNKINDYDIPKSLGMNAVLIKNSLQASNVKKNKP